MVSERLPWRVWDAAPRPLKRGAKAMWGGWARLTSERRLLPDWVIIGTQRGGTTSLYNYLADHPDVGRALTKELRYFDLNHDRGLSWYRSRFPSEKRRDRARRRGGDLVVGEASPDYLFYAAVPGRMAEVLPHVRLVVLLRDPTERAISHWWHGHRLGYEPLALDVALREDLERTVMSTPAERAARMPVVGDRSYVARGLYAEQLERWLQRYRRDQLLVLRSEDLFTSPQEVLHSTLEFLELEPWSPRQFPELNRMRQSDVRPPVARELDEFFSPHNERLAALLGTDLGWRGPH